MKKTIIGKYFHFLLLTVFKKKFVWIIGALYLLVLAVFLFIVPSIIGRSPFYVWSNDTISIQSMTCYFSAIFSAMLVLAIYKDFRDNGTELLIISKPISRSSMLLTKMIVYLIYSLALSVASAILGLFVFCFDVSLSEQWSLIANVFLITFIFLIIFGAVTLIVSIYLSKIWVILFPILLCAFSNIYYIVINYANVVDTPTDDIVKNDDASIKTISYLESDGKTHSEYAYIVSQKDIDYALQKISTSPTRVKPLEFYEKRKINYEDAVNASNYKIPNYFNTTSQIRLMGNAFALKDNLISKCNIAFGISRNMNYHIDDNFIVNKFNPNNQTYPLMFLDYDGLSYLSSEDASDFTKSVEWLSKPENITSVIQNQEFYTIGSYETTTNSIAKLTTTLTLDDYYSFEIKYADSRNVQYLSPDKISLNNEEKTFFDILLNSTSPIEFKKHGQTQSEASLPEGLITGQVNRPDNNKPFNNVGVGLTGSLVFINNKKSLNFESPTFMPHKQDGSDITFSKFSEYVHYCLLNEISNDHTNWLSLDIDTNEDLMFEALKFKYYIMVNEYRDMQSQYLNPYFNAYSLNHSYLFNNEHTGAFVLPFDIDKITETGPLFKPNQMFYDNKYIAISTIAKNFCLAIDSTGYATQKTYQVGNKTYLEPEDYDMRKGGNIGIISTSADPTFTTELFAFTFHSEIEFSPESLYIIYTFIAIAMFTIAYVIYSRIDFK